MRTAASKTLLLILLLVVFDEHGRLAEVNNYDGKGTLEGWTKLTRDGRGNVTEAEEGEGSFRRTIASEYEFDHTGNWVKATQSSSVFKDGWLISESYGVKYRTITYYRGRT